MIVESTFAGVGRHVLDLCQGLAELAHEVHLIYSPRRMEPSFASELARLATRPALVCTPHEMSRSVGLADWTSIRFVRRYLRERGPFDVIHGQSSKGGAIARLAGLGFGCSRIYTPHALVTMNPELRPLGRALYAIAEWTLARLGGEIITVSREEKRHALLLRLPERRLHVVSNGIDRMEGPDRETARAELGLGGEARLIGFVGRLCRQKAPELLVEAFDSVHREQPDTELAVVGSGELLEELQQQASELPCSRKIHFLGHRPGQRAMRAFDVFVLPSRYEAHPYVLLEAVGAGLPIVASAMAGPAGLVEDGVNGRIVPPSAQALARGLLDALEMAADGASARARQRMSRQLVDISGMVEATLEVYAGARR